MHGAQAAAKLLQLWVVGLTKGGFTSNAQACDFATLQLPNTTPRQLSDFAYARRTVALVRQQQFNLPIERENQFQGWFNLEPRHSIRYVVYAATVPCPSWESTLATRVCCMVMCNGPALDNPCAFFSCSLSSCVEKGVHLDCPLFSRVAHHNAVIWIFPISLEQDMWGLGACVLVRTPSIIRPRMCCAPLSMIAILT